MSSIVAGVLCSLGINVTGVGAELLDSATSILFTGVGKRVWKGAKTRFAAYMEVPDDQDLALVIRFAELTSSLVVINAYQDVVDQDSFDTRFTKADTFVPSARQWLHSQIGISSSFKLENNNKLVTQLNNSLDQAMASQDFTDVRRSLSQSEKSVWKDIVDGASKLGGGSPSEELKQAFFGECDSSPGWAATFLAFVREALKNNPRAEISFVTERLALLRTEVKSINDRIGVILREQNAQHDTLRRVEAKLDSGVLLNRDQIDLIAGIIRNLHQEQTDVLAKKIDEANIGNDAVWRIIKNFLRHVGHSLENKKQLAKTFQAIAEQFISLREIQGKPPFVSELEIDEKILMEKVIILMEGKNSDGMDAYTYLLITLNRLYDLRVSLQGDQIFSPSDYGEVLAFGEGVLSPAMKAELTQKFNIANGLEGDIKSPETEVVFPRLTLEEASHLDPSKFVPEIYIHRLESGYLLCGNPVIDGGITSITVNPSVTNELRIHLEISIRKMVFDDLIHPKFGQVIVAASRMD